MTSTNWVKARRGIVDHLKEMRMCVSDFAVFQLLLLQANKENGVAWASSAVVASYFPDMSPRTAKDALRRLKEKGYIREFREQGSRGSYPILIDKYEISVGDLKGCLTNAEQTVDWEHPAVSERPEDSREEGREDRPEGRREDRPPYSSPQVPESSTPANSNPADQSGMPTRRDIKTGKPIEPHTPLPEMVKQIIDAYPMTPLNEAVRRKWDNAILMEIENMIPPNGLWADRDIAADWLLHQVKQYALYRTPKQGWSLDKFMRDGHYDRPWDPPDEKKLLKKSAQARGTCEFCNIIDTDGLANGKWCCGSDSCMKAAGIQEAALDALCSQDLEDEGDVFKVEDVKDDL